MGPWPTSSRAAKRPCPTCTLTQRQAPTACWPCCRQRYSTVRRFTMRWEHGGVFSRACLHACVFCMTGARHTFGCGFCMISFVSVWNSKHLRVRWLAGSLPSPETDEWRLPQWTTGQRKFLQYYASLWKFSYIFLWSWTCLTLSVLSWCFNPQPSGTPGRLKCLRTICKCVRISSGQDHRHCREIWRNHSQSCRKLWCSHE